MKILSQYHPTSPGRRVGGEKYVPQIAKTIPALCSPKTGKKCTSALRDPSHPSHIGAKPSVGSKSKPRLPNVSISVKASLLQEANNLKSRWKRQLPTEAGQRPKPRLPLRTRPGRCCLDGPQILKWQMQAEHVRGHQQLIQVGVRECAGATTPFLGQPDHLPRRVQPP